MVHYRYAPLECSCMRCLMQALHACRNPAYCSFPGNSIFITVI